MLITTDNNSQQLYYNESHNGSTPQWGGNISAMDWQAAGETQGTSPATGRQRGYSFAYDGLSRLTQADYHEDNQRSNHYDTHYTYDLMGNITALQRSGLHDDGAYSLIDDLTFEYEGNQIIKVTDGVTDGPYRKDAWHYRDRVDADIEREYDGNGNLVKDLDAGILRIEYNSLNLPQMIKFSDHSKHVYTYDATGRKLRAEYHTPIMVVAEPQVPDMGEEMPEQEEVLMEEQQEEWNEEEWEEWEMEEETEEPQPQPNEPLVPSPIGNVPPLPTENGDEEIILPVIPGNEPVIDEVPCEVTTVDYCGDFIYVNGVLKRMLFPGGYVTFRNDSIEHPEYHFYLTDHQGNIRVVANQNGEVEQVNHYYPYGGLMGESTNCDHQPYKYNGKELDRHHGLDWFDYGARWYNGYSWTTPDPHAESYYDTSPYIYCNSSPINYIDLDGRDGIAWIDKEKKTITISQTFYYNRENENFKKLALSENKIVRGVTYISEFSIAQGEKGFSNFSSVKTMNDGEWTFNYNVEFVGVDGDDAVQEALLNNPKANSIIFDENYEKNAGDYDPKTRTITMGRNRRTNFDMRGETLIHEIGHSWGLPHENQMPNAPTFNKENELGIGIMSYGKSRTIQQHEIEYGVNQILNVANTSPKNEVQIHVKGTGYKHQIIK